MARVSAWFGVFEVSEEVISPVPPPVDAVRGPKAVAEAVLPRAAGARADAPPRRRRSAGARSRAAIRRNQWWLLGPALAWAWRPGRAWRRGLALMWTRT